MTKFDAVRAFRTLFTATIFALAGAALADDQPRYEPPPEWVVQGALPAAPVDSDGAPVEILLWDQQLHLDTDGPHVYVRIAMRVTAPQGLMDLNSVSAEWSPQFQSLTIHHVEIRRGQAVIDALAGGREFAVLRREANLEFAMLDGALTAVLQPEGLRVGDILDFAYSVSGADPVLERMAQSTMPLPQFDAERIRLRTSWDRSLDVRWQASNGLGDLVRETREGRDRVVEIELDHPEPVFPPTGAPGRFLLPPHIAFSAYASWQQVSSQIAPLFERAEKLPANSAVQEEIDRIRAEFDTPLERATAALRMVQDDVRYLYVGLDYGGLLPASAEDTWSRRFGDCKAKSVLLLAMLHGLDIEAEAVLVQSFAGDALSETLPMVAAFDHVIVRAAIEGSVYWLDGTDAGTGSIDHAITPFYHWGLPLRPEGAELVEVRPAPLTEPDTRISLLLDYSSGITVPGKVEGELVLRGPTAEFLRQSVQFMTAEEVEEAYRGIWAAYLPSAEIAAVDGRSTPASGEYGITMTGTVRWAWDSKRYRSRVGDLVLIQEPESRPPDEDQDAPYSVVFPSYVEMRETLLLPQDGEGFRVEGGDVDVTAMGVHMLRSARKEGSSVIIEGSTRSLQSEIPASAIADARRRLASLRGEQLYVYAPTNYTISEAEQVSALGPVPETAKEFIDRGIVNMNSGRLSAAVEDFSSAIDLDPDGAFGWANRGLAYAWQRDMQKARDDLQTAQSIDANNVVAFRAYGLIALREGNHAEAIEQFTRSLEIDPENAFAYQMRASARMSVSDSSGAFEDARSATRLDPTIAEPYLIQAIVHGVNGRSAQALSVLREMLESANVNPPIFRQAAQIFARSGDRESAIDAVHKAFAAQPVASDMVMSALLRDASAVEERRADLEAALEIEPASREARLNLARLHIDGRSPDQAILLLDALIERDSNDAEALGERGIAFALEGDTSRADLDFASAHSNAETATDFNNLCWRKATLDVALEQALLDCQRAIEIEDRAAFQDSLGLVYLRLGRFDDSIRAYDAALASDQNGAHSLFGRGLAKREKGDRRGSARDMDEALRLQPEIGAAYEGYGIAL